MPDEIDPQLPFIQLHRSVLQRASVLAPSLGMPTSQAIGCMVLFWMELSDRRLLGPHIPKGMVVLRGPELTRRLRLAFGKPVDLEDFIIAGLIERQGNALGDGDGTLFRVRGMSRQLETEARRLKIKRTLKSRVEPQVEPQVELDIGERREVRGEASKNTEPAAPSAPVEEAFKAVPTDRRVDPLRAQKQELLDDYELHRGEKYLSTEPDWIAYAKLRKTYAHEVIRARWLKGLQSTDKWTRISTLRSLPGKWNDLADDVPAPVAAPAKRLDPGQKPLVNYSAPDAPDPYRTDPNAIPLFARGRRNAPNPRAEASGSSPEGAQAPATPGERSGPERHRAGDPPRGVPILGVLPPKAG